MRLRYAVLCDYASPGLNGKPTIIGVYEAIYARPPQPGELITTSPGFLHAMIDSPSSMGPRHLLSNRLIDADGKTVAEFEHPISFNPRTSNPASQFVHSYGFIHPIGLPGYGDYEWVFLIDGNSIGSIPFVVIEMPPEIVAQMPPQK